LSNSADEQLAAIAAKSIKEVTYHKRFSSEWVVRLGDGTAESKEKMQRAIYSHWDYTGELFESHASFQHFYKKNTAVDSSTLKREWEIAIAETLKEATLTFPMSIEGAWHQTGGVSGIHTEYMGYILAELQFMQKSYPGAEW
jgi:Uncharacterized conserved protein